MNIGVIGCGRWGSFIAWYLNKTGHNVTLYGRTTSESYNRIVNTRTNGMLTFDRRMSLTDDLSLVVKNQILVISVGAQSLRGLCCELLKEKIEATTIVLCMKGIEIDSGKRLSEIVTEELLPTYPNIDIAVWLGPGHAQDFSNGVRGCMVIDSYNETTKYMLVDEFSSPLIRFYYGDDMIGNEIGAAAKNVIGIAAGMLDAMNMTGLKGALTTRSSYEVSKLIKAMGGKPISAYGLCHLGDYAATVFSEYSQNRQFGMAFAKKEPYSKLAEGYYTVKPIVMLSKKHGVSMPICNAIYEVLYEAKPMEIAIAALMEREKKTEYQI